MSSFAPRIITIKINPEKIRDIIGKGGSVIRKIQEETGTEINVEDDGTVQIAAVSGENSRKAVQWIESLTREVEVGGLYLGKVTRIMGFGCFVEILPGKEGLVRIGELADYHVPTVEDVVSVGDEVMVVVTEIDRQGRVNLSRKAAMQRHLARNGASSRRAGPAGEPRRPESPASHSRRMHTRGVRYARRDRPAGPLVYSGRARKPRRASGAMSREAQPLTVAVVGATGVVGRTMIQVLSERHFPVGELRLLASGRSAGTTVSADGRTLTVGEATARGFRGRGHRPLLGRDRRFQAAGARGGGARRHGHRQLQRLADGCRGARSSSAR